MKDKKLTLTRKQAEFVQAARSLYGSHEDLKLSRSQILAVCDQFNLKEPQWLIKPAFRVARERGMYHIPTLMGRVVESANKNTQPVKDDSVVLQNVLNIAKTQKGVEVPMESSVSKAVKLAVADANYENLVPARDKNFVRFGIYQDLKVIIASNIFYPVFISGLSGNGKSFTPEQICAELKREFIRVNITKQTNEDDLLGGYRLVNGETVWFDGPVVQAAERGCVLLLDEVDYGSAEITCMQNVLEGKPFLIKKINKIVTPKEGFNIIATANTKGQGDNLGKFVFTNVLNEAFLERFSVTLEQEYPPSSVETKIMKNYFKTFGLEEEAVGNYADLLVKWANVNRESFKKGAISEIISTRRLVHIAKAYVMFKDRVKAVEICLNRFDDETKSGLLDLYKKMDAAPVENTITKNATTGNTVKKDPDGGIPF
jgi:hypothetical protein